MVVFHRVTPFLLPTVQSVLGQTFRDLELVLVDHGTGAGLTPLGESGRDPRIRLVSRPENEGIACGYNQAIAHARGEFIALLDHDDIALPRRIERQIEFLRANPRFGMVSTLAVAIDERGDVTGPEFSLLTERDQYVFSAYTAPAVMPSYTGRREVFERFRYRREVSYACDYDLLARAAEAWPICGVPEVLMHYRHHAGQTTNVRAAAHVLAACVARHLAARRRAGRAEDLAGMVVEFGSWLGEAPPPAETYARFAECALRDGFARLAVYHARKLLSVRRDLPTLFEATRVLQAALRMEPRGAALLLRLFFTGPLRAHGLRPA
jgi:GT2 family glycosyltransferase